MHDALLLICVVTKHRFTSSKEEASWVPESDAWCVTRPPPGWLVKRASEELPAGTEIPGGGGRGRLYLTLHCHHQNDSCIKTGSEDSRFKVSLIVRSKVTKTVSINHKF